MDEFNQSDYLDQSVNLTHLQKSMQMCKESLNKRVESVTKQDYQNLEN